MLCDYGCGHEAKYTTTNNKKCCSEHYNSCPAVRKKNSDATCDQHRTNSNMYKFDQLDRDNANKAIKERVVQEFLDGKYKGSNGAIRNLLFKEFGVEYKCQNCGIDEWQGEKIPLELDHINGRSTDNRPDNLRLLCPNCHSITLTWRGKNINNGKVKVSDQTLLTALEKCSNIRQALLEVGLAAKGGNYNRAKKLLSRSGGIGDTQET